VSASNERSDAVRVLDDATVHMLARHWEDGWNRGDLETIMAPFAQDVVFSSPGVSMMTGDPAKTTIEGADALREYIDGALRRTRGISYTLQATYAGTDSVVLVYGCGFPDGAQKPGADLMRVDRDRMVVEWRCHY
jgi:steroid delta-isomerase